MSKIAYRPDIDGLRALAVLSVLFYHAGFSFLPGGFMGVDIFFVISGYLITSFIMKDLREGTFSMPAFWERRARRILPPLFVVAACSLVAGWFIFLPGDLVQFGKELAGQAAFGSNFLFTKQGGYFHGSNDVKALLHTWSLAVEEQFYLFFPIGMYVIYRFARKSMGLLLWAGFLAGFVLAAIYVHISQRYTFYLLPFRFWELLAGALIAAGYVPQIRKETHAQIISTIAMALILAGLLLYKKEYLFPGVSALPAVLGTALLIWANGAYVTRIGQIMSWRIFVWIGLISYSLYLWHWPLIVFVRYALYPISDLTVPIAFACLTTTFALAWLSWRFIEQPVRKRQIFATRRSIFLASFAGLLCMAGIGGALVFTKGAPMRFSESVDRYISGSGDTNPYRPACDRPSVDNINASNLCETNKEAGKPRFVVWGDSHGDAMGPAFFDLSKQHRVNGYVITAHGCTPVMDTQWVDTVYRYDCAAFNKAVLDLIDRENIKNVLIVSHWKNRFREGEIQFQSRDWYSKYEGTFPNIAMAGLARTIDDLHAKGIKVSVLKGVPVATKNVPRMLAMQERYEIEPKYIISHEDYLHDVERAMGQFQSLYKGQVSYMDPSTVLCHNTVCDTQLDGKPLYFDDNHLSATGARYIEPAFEPFFKNMR